MKILFLHGWNSTPGGRKPTCLRNHGHEVLNPALPDDDFAAAVAIAQAEYDRHQPDAVVGSSRGGAVAVNIDSGDTPQVLLCPAWKTWGTARTAKQKTTILHSRSDETVPFEDSKEIICNSSLLQSALIEVGRDHRLADPEPLEAMLAAIKIGTNAPVTLVGCDFGAPAQAGDQARKIILIEATKIAEHQYAVTTDGRNARLASSQESGAWWQRRPGWTLPGLAVSLSIDPSVRVAALDFPFSIPLSLLRDTEFAGRLDQQPFGSREAWNQYVADNLPLVFANPLAKAKLEGLALFQGWRDKAFWHRRETDRATGGQPPLKHRYQNLFSMTLAGASLLRRLVANGYREVMTEAVIRNGRCLMEAYPGKTAERIGFNGRYKNEPEKCFRQAESYLQNCGITLDVDERIRRFCQTYRSQGNDPDGADAFLCLVSAIAFHEGYAELCPGDADAAILAEEGCIVVPRFTGK
jgi:hypothetical protein